MMPKDVLVLVLCQSRVEREPQGERLWVVLQGHSPFTRHSWPQTPWGCPVWCHHSIRGQK